jgi:hypothetical protein
MPKVKLGETVNVHWASRDKFESQVKLCRCVDILRDMGLTYSKVLEVFDKSIKDGSFDPIEFDTIMHCSDTLLMNH